MTSAKAISLTAAFLVAGATSLAPATAAPASPSMVQLGANEATAAGMSREWRNSRPVVVRGGQGEVLFAYGLSQPQVVCAPLQVCDIAFQPGEALLNVDIGDRARWKVTPARSGAGPTERVHLIIKPVDVGLQSSLVVTSNRRVYHLGLRSHPTEYMARVAFDYPDDPAVLAAQLDAANPSGPAGAVEGDIGAAGLNFAYGIYGKAPWRPERVYNDGTKTYVDMPRRMETSEAPTLLVIGPGKQQRLVNYRINDRRYIVDQIFDRAVLITGTGKRQTKITLIREVR